jgi:hypothetical protein
VSPGQDTEEVTGRNQECQCPQTESVASEETSGVTRNSPLSKQKGQLFSQCACLRQISQNDTQESKTVNAEGKVDSSPKLPHRNVQCPTQVPVTRLNEKFLQDCMCLNRAPESSCVPECPDELDSDKPTSPLQIEKQTRQEILQQSREECMRVETDDAIGQLRQEHRETSSTPEQCVNSAGSLEERSLQTRPQSSLNRAVPVPTVGTSQGGHKESQSQSVRESPIASQSLNNGYLSHSQCNTSRLSPHPSSGEGSNHLHSPPKQTNEKADLSVQSVSSQGRPGHEGISLTNTSSNQSSEGQRSVCSARNPSNPEESPTVKPLCSELPEQLGSPAHTSTPKTSSATTPSKLLVTRNRPLRCSGSGKKHGRPVNLLTNFTR